MELQLGSYVQNGKRITVTESDAERQKDKGKDEYRLVVKLKREGEAVFPVEVKLTYENNQAEWRNWDGRDRWVK